MKLVPFADFPLHERDALHAALARLRIPPQHVCVSRLQPVPGDDDSRLPVTVLVSAPGWSRSYQGAGWVQSVERDLAALARGASPLPIAARQGLSSGPAPLAAE